MGIEHELSGMMGAGKREQSFGTSGDDPQRRNFIYRGSGDGFRCRRKVCQTGPAGLKLLPKATRKTS